MTYIKILILTIITGCTTIFLNAQDLVILHTNDTHSQILPHKTLTGEYLGGYERREEYIKQIRSQHKNVLLLDAGDFSQGTPFFNLYKGNVEIELMNALNYDAACIGNHEFDNGQQELARRINNAKFPIVCANYDLTKSPLQKCVKPYTIIEKGGKKIGIIGFILNVKGIISPSNFETIKYKNPIPIADSLAKMLKQEQHVDLVIALTHNGFNEGSPSNPGDLRIAKETKYIDIIVGGHSHTPLEDKYIVKNKDNQEVIVLQDGEKGDYVGRLDIWFK